MAAGSESAMGDVVEKATKEVRQELASKARQYGYILTEDKFSAPYLSAFNFKIKTVLDVGVHQGTEPLYNAFPRARIVSFDPSPVSLKIVTERYPHLLPDFNQVALGKAAGTLTLSMMGGASTLLQTLQAVEENARFQGKIEVPVVTLDSVVEEKGYEGPFGLKIDAEGYEMEILAGAEKTIKQCEFIIAEVGIRHRFVGQYFFSDIVAFMASRGFEFASVLNDRVGIPQNYDCLFIRREHNRVAGLRTDL